MLVVDVEKLVSELMFPAPPSQQPKQGIRHSLLSTCLMERFHLQKSSGVPVCQLYFTMYVLAFFTHLGNNGALCQKMLWAWARFCWGLQPIGSRWKRSLLLPQLFWRFLKQLLSVQLTSMVIPKMYSLWLFECHIISPTCSCTISSSFNQTRFH